METGIKKTLYFVSELSGPSWSHSSLKKGFHINISSDVPLEARLKIVFV